MPEVFMSGGYDSVYGVGGEVPVVDGGGGVDGQALAGDESQGGLLAEGACD